MADYQSIIFSDGNRKADIKKVPRPGRASVYRLTVCENFCVVTFQKAFPTYGQARAQLTQIGKDFRMVA